MNTKQWISWRVINAACIVLLLIAGFLVGSRSRVSAAVDSVHVPANAGWVSTGIYLEQYHQVYLDAYGSAHTGKINLLPASKSGPGGQTWNLGCSQYEGAASPCALNDAPYGALVGKIGEDGAAFLIGDAQHFEVPATGELFFAVNDNLEYYADNQGGFNIVFRAGNMAGGYMAARPDIDLIEGRYWTPGVEVRLRIFDKVNGLLYQETQLAASEPFDPAGTNVSFDLAEKGFDLLVGQRVLMSSGGHTRELWIAPVAVTGFSFQGPSVSGTCDPAIFCWAHLDGDRDAWWFDPDEGNWTAHFDYLVPWEGGWAFQWDEDGDETRIRFQIDTADARMIAAFPEEDVIEGDYWKVGLPVTLRVFDLDQGQIYEQTLPPEEDESRPGGSFLRVDLRGQVDIQPGYTITMTNGLVGRALVVSPIAVTDVSLAERTVSGVCDPTIFCYTHMDDGREANEIVIAEDGNWTAHFDWLVPNEWGQAFQWEADGDETRIHFRTSIPKIMADAWNETVTGAEWAPGGGVTVWVDDPTNGPGVDHTATGTVSEGSVYTSWVFIRLDFDLKSGDIVTMSDGTVTKELVVAPLWTSAFHLGPGGTITGTFDPSQPIWTDAGGVLTTDGETWALTFEDLKPGTWMTFIQTDQDHDETRLTIRTSDPRFTAWLYWNTVDANEFEIGRTVTLTIGSFTMKTDVLPADWAPWDPTLSHAHFNLGDGHALAPGDHVVVSDGVTTKELDIPTLSVTGYDLEAKTVSGTYDPALPLSMYVHEIGPTNITYVGNTWVATFAELQWDWWGDAVQRDADGDDARATIHTAE